MKGWDIMLGLIIGLMILTCMLGIGFKLTGALLAACIWLFIEIPIAFAVWVIGIVCCCTIILIPVGLGLFKVALKLLIPGI